MRATQLTKETEIAAVNRLYQLMPDIGVERTDISTFKVAKDINLTESQTSRVVRRLEELKILSRRIVYGGNTGRQSYWQLLLPREEALAKMGTNPMAPVKTNTIRNMDSLRNRMLTALTEKSEFESVQGMLEFIRTPGENIDVHSMTHILKALRDQGKVQFKMTQNGSGPRKQGGKGNGVPYGIHLNKNMAVTTPSARSWDKHIPEDAITVLDIIEPGQKQWVPSKSVGADRTFAKGGLRGYVAEGGPIERSKSPEPVIPLPAPEAEPEAEPVSPSITGGYPLIERLVKRRELLTQAAYLADEGGASDIAPQLLELAEKPLPAIEQEMVNLWKAYQECQNKS